MTLAPRPPKEDPSLDRVIEMFQSEAGELRQRRPPLRARMTLLLLAAMLGGIAIVSAVFQMDRVVTSVFGQIVTVDPNSVLQPLDISILRTIDVQEGDVVKKGQQIASLDPTLTTADVVSLQTQIEALDAEIARCEAELDHAPYEYVAVIRHGAEDYAALQRSLYAQRKAQFNSQVHAYDEQIALAKATIFKLTADKDHIGDRGAIYERIEKMWVGLQAKDSASVLQTLTARDEVVQMVKALEYDQNSIAETEHQIQSTGATRDAYIQQWSAQTSEELVKARTQRDTFAQQLDKALKHQDMIRLIAPEDAVVLRLDKRSIGSVLQTADVFAELALLKSPIEAEIFIDPLEIGFVRPGDKVTIKLDPYHYVEHGVAEGVVRWVSQGTFTAPPIGTGGAAVLAGTAGSGGGTAAPSGNAPYYKARIVITRTDLVNVPADFRLLPGTTLEADIHVGTRSVFWYLVRGMVRGYQESMREP